LRGKFTLAPSTVHDVPMHEVPPMYAAPWKSGASAPRKDPEQQGRQPQWSFFLGPE
jgi:hypothetical protein